MKIVTLISCCLFILPLAVTTNAHDLKHDQVLTIDNPPAQLEDLSFPETESIQPDKSDFKIKSIILLSNTSGERHATVTFENTANGQRILTSDHVLAIFADGQKVSPKNLKHKFSRKQQITLNLNFGVRKFPILTVYTNT